MITKGTIIRILDRGVVVELENHIEGFVPTFQLGQDVKKPSDAFDVDEELPLKVIEFDKDQRKIVLSVRDYFKDRDRAEFEEFKEKHTPKPVTIGDAFGDILESAPTEAEKKAETPQEEAPKAEAVAEEPEVSEEVSDESAEEVSEEKPEKASAEAEAEEKPEKDETEA